MQITHLKGNKVEKVLRDKEGRLIRATFYVYESAGRIRARLLDFSVINELSGDTLSLSIPNKTHSKENSHLNSFVSRYFTKDTLQFSGSKPRAPTF